MAHGSADDVDGHVAGLGDACPTVAGDIEGEGRCELEMGGVKEGRNCFPYLVKLY